MVSEDIGMAGHYTIKKIKNQEYLYKISYDKEGKQKWDIIDNVKDLDPKHQGLIEAKTVILGKQVRKILHRYLSGSIDKVKAKAELIKLLEDA